MCSSRGGRGQTYTAVRKMLVLSQFLELRVFSFFERWSELELTFEPVSEAIRPKLLVGLGQMWEMFSLWMSGFESHQVHFLGGAH